MTHEDRGPDAGAPYRVSDIWSVPVRETPHSVAVSPDGSRVYVTHFLSGEISVIDADTRAVTSVFQDSPGIYGIAVARGGEHLYVANPGTGFVHQIRAADGMQNISAGIGVGPYGLAMGENGLLYAACPLTDSVEVLDGLVKNVSRLNNVGFAVCLAVSRDNDRLYASRYFDGSIAEISVASIASGTFDGQAEVRANAKVAVSPYGVALSPDGDHLFIAHFNVGDIVSILRTDTLAQVQTLRVGSGPVRGLAVSPDGVNLYVTNYFSSSVAVIQLEQA